MGSVGHVETFDRESAETKVDPGGTRTVTAQHYTPPGFDGSPLPGDFVALQPCAGTGRIQELGVCDPIAANRKAANGEGRVYARNAQGVAVCEVHCKADGSIVIAVLDGTAPIEIRSEGPITVNSPDVRLGAGGQPIATVGSLVSGTLHGISAGPGAPIVPGPPIPGGGVPFVARVISGVTGVTSANGTGT